MRTLANRPHVQALAALVLGSLAAYATAGPDPVKVENKQRLQATVTSIDLDKRLVTLKADNGNQTTVEVSPDVTNLPQVKAGDKVVVDYYQGLAAQFRKKGESETVGKVDQTDAVARAVTADAWEHSYPRERAAFPTAAQKLHKYWPTVGRIDDAYGDRNLMCACPPWEPEA